MAPEIVLTSDQLKIVEMGKDCRKMANRALDIYRLFIREVSKLLPKVQTAVLLAAGWTKSEASQMKAVASLPPADLKAYVEGQLTWRPALDKAREAKSVRTGKQRKVSPFSKVISAAMRVKHKLAGCHFHDDGREMALVLVKRTSCRVAIAPGILGTQEPSLLMLINAVPSTIEQTLTFGDVVVRYAVEKQQ
jgi:hypothetical protein